MSKKHVCSDIDLPLEKTLLILSFVTLTRPILIDTHLK